MATKITTKYGSNNSGASVIVARSGKVQKTTPYNSALSADQNHGIAAAALVQHIDSKNSSSSFGTELMFALGRGEVQHDYPENGVQTLVW